MNESAHVQSLLNDIQRQHRELQDRLQALRRLVREPVPPAAIGQRLGEVATALAEMREQMVAHFAEEDAGGVMEEAVARLPRLADEAATIEREHPELLRRLDEALQAVRQAEASPETWSAACELVDTFATSMLGHEARENKVLRDGFNIAAE